MVHSSINSFCNILPSALPDVLPSERGASLDKDSISYLVKLDSTTEPPILRKNEKFYTVSGNYEPAVVKINRIFKEQ